MKPRSSTVLVSLAVALGTSLSAANAIEKNAADSLLSPSSSSKPISPSARKKAVEEYLSAAKAMEKGDARTAEKSLMKAVELDPEEKNYSTALTVARSYIVTSLVQEAEKARLTGDTQTARKKLEEALTRDPKNLLVTQHAYELSQDTASSGTEAEAMIAAPPISLTPKAEKQSLHLKAPNRELIRRVLSLYGIEATVDDSVKAQTNRLDIDDLDFEQATHALTLVTGTFLTPLDPKRVLVAADTKENRQNYQRQVVETVYLPGLSAAEVTDVSNIAKQIFDAQQATAQQGNGTLTLRVPEKSLRAFNNTLARLLDGNSQVVLDVKLIELTRTRSRNVGTQLPQQTTAFNLLTEANSVINSNQSLVNEIISSGLAKEGDWQTIAAILIASGAIGNSVLSQPFAVFGGGITMTGLTMGKTTVNLGLNSAESRVLDDIRLRVGDKEAATFRSGSKYPITTSSYSNLSSASSTLGGLTSAGVSSSLLASLGVNLGSLGATSVIPQIQYQDLGLTLKATPHILKTGDVSISVEMKIDALGGSSLNDIPILNSRTFTGTITVPDSKSALIISNLNRQESKAVSGLPMLSYLPGFSNLTSEKDTAKDISSLVILMTPHIVRRDNDVQNTTMIPIPQH